MAAPEIDIEDLIKAALVAALPDDFAVETVSMRMDMQSMLRTENSVLIRTADVAIADISYQNVGHTGNVTIRIMTEVYITSRDVRSWDSSRSTVGIFEIANIVRKTLSGLEPGTYFIGCINFESQAAPQIEEPERIAWLVQSYSSRCRIRQ